MVSLGNTRIPAFLEGQQILTWDAAYQKKTLSRIFGGGVDVNVLDIAGEIGQEIPSTAGKSLLRIKELSKIARYSEKEAGELEVFINLFTSFVYLREKLYSPEDAEDLQLACLGTVADIMPLKDENRIIVRQGLSSIMGKPRPGLSDLLFKMDLSGRPLGTHEISWLICPAINAAGRMGSPHTAAALFLEQDPPARDNLADKLIAMNEERKKLGGEVWISVEVQAEKNLEQFGRKLAMASGNIPRGITGIMANRLVSRFKIPSLVVSVGDKILTGSLRSYRNYDLRFLLEPCAHLFIDWGGHDFAAGFSMEKSNWDVFLGLLQRLAQAIDLGEEEEEKVEVDAELPLNYLTPDILNLVDRFEPYGEGNEPLTFMARGLKVSELNLMGKTEANHVKLSLDTGRYRWPAVYWQAADRVKKDFDLEDRVDLAFRVTRDWFNGRETPQLVVSDLRREGAG
jgi:single-stranded-DNA-specific exonuclease